MISARGSRLRDSACSLLGRVARRVGLSFSAATEEGPFLPGRDEEAHAKFVEIRWADNDGQPYCPECGCAKVYAFATRKLWKCSACRYQFSVTARTISQDRKRPIRDYLQGSRHTARLRRPRRSFEHPMANRGGSEG